jgi:NAD-dependent dihydropyrimidine dehydrogenase PreA subunit
MDIYQRLALHLDNLPGGFPSTESGVELRILKRLYTPDDAELALHVTLIPEKSRLIARRAGINIAVAGQRLEEMARKGLIYGRYPKKGPPSYQAANYAVGIWEFQVNRLNNEFVQDMDEYWPTFFNLDTWEKAPQMRTIPVNESVNVLREVMIYEQAEELIRAYDRISLAPCICRQEHGLKGEVCEKPFETCMQFGSIADFYIHHGKGRMITQQEALDVLHLANENGLVLQPNNSRDAAFLCCCCGCCCAVLRNIKRHPRPASIVTTPFIAGINAETCSGCMTCIDRCQMEAIKVNSGKVFIDKDRCIGCGLCVSKCPDHILVLLRKPLSEQKEVPKSLYQTYIRIGRNRSKLSTGGMIGMLIRSKLDRLMTTKCRQPH